MTELRKLIELCKQNDPKSQKELYDRYCRQMYTICLRYCKNSGDAADVLQEGFIKVFDKISQFRSEGDIGKWIRTTIVRTALRAIKQRVEFVEICEETNESAAYEMQIDFDNYNYHRILKHLHTMPIGYQTVFNLYVFEEMTHTEISRELNISESSSRSQLFKARKALQNKIEKDAQLQNLVRLRT
ncbi:MAG: sigma-70 family RNA polymerase sigma factor [Bacteroidia bacterium]|nr:sigma-70 family RNA polymerase sigma factor [Bacteroidia bacterium]